MNHLILIDVSGFAYRAFYAHSPRTRASDGLQTHAVEGFLSLAWRLLKRAEADPYTHVAACFDHPSKTFRHRLYDGYKAQRAARPEGLTAQLPLLREAARCLGLEPVELKGYEADDVIATLATRAKAAAIRSTIVAVDKDFCGLVEDNVIEIADPVQHKRILEKDVFEKFGVEPRLVPDVQALSGDTADNIPGVFGIGPTNAAKLIARFGSLAALMEAIDKNARPPACGPGMWSSLRHERKNLPLYRKLATLRCDVPLKIGFDALVPKEVRRAHLMDMLRVLEAEERFGNLFGGDAKLFRPVEHVADPLKWWRTELKRPGQKIPDLPQCGFYRRRLVKGGAPVPARIWREPETDFETGKATGRDTLNCEVNGERADALSNWGYISAQPITEAKFNLMKAEAAQAKVSAPASSAANPHAAIDWNREPL